MHRPTRQLKNVEEKLATKTARSKGKVGKKAKRWKKSVEAYKALAQ